MLDKIDKGSKENWHSSSILNEISCRADVNHIEDIKPELIQTLNILTMLSKKLKNLGSWTIGDLIKC